MNWLFGCRAGFAIFSQIALLLTGLAVLLYWHEHGLSWILGLIGAVMVVSSILSFVTTIRNIMAYSKE